MLVMILMPLARQCRQDRPHPLGEQRVVALRGILHLRLLGEGDGALGQAFEDQVLEVALLGQLDRRLDPVAGEAGAGFRS